MPIVDGIVSGMDTTGLINAILAAQAIPIQTMKVKMADYEKQMGAVAGIKNRFATLSDSIRKMSTPDLFQSSTVTTSATQYTMHADGNALPGSYAVRVVNLASAEVSRSQGFADPNAHTLAKGNFEVTVAGVKHDVTIDDTNNSLTDMVAALNNIDGITSYVLDTGVSGNQRYRLMVQGDSVGAANDVSFKTAGMNGGTKVTMTELTSAVDAQVTIGGVTIYVASNTLNGAIPGIRIELKQAGPAPEVSVVARDGAAMREKFKAVIDAYNDIQTYHGTQTAYNPELGIRGPLIAESTTRRAMDDLSNQFSKAWPANGSDFSSLGMLGVKTERDGKLSFDEAAFDTAFASDPEGVTSFLTASDGPLNVVADRIDSLYVDSTSGTLVSRGKGIESTIKTLSDDIFRAEERMDSTALMLRERFSAMEVVLGQLQSTQGYLSNFFDSMSTSS